MTGENSRTDRPVTLQWASWLLYVQGAGLAGLTALLVFLDLTEGHARIAAAVALTVLTAVAAVAVVIIARALNHRTARARGPAIVVQLFMIAAGGFLVQVHPVWLGLLLILLGVLVGLLILLPPSTRALGVD